MTRDRVVELLRVVGDPPAASSDGVRAAMRGNRRRDSVAELRLRSALHASGLRFRVDYPIRVPGWRPIRPDLVFTRARLAVFVDGCFWHGCPEHGTAPRSNPEYWAAKIELNQTRDALQAAALHEADWLVIRVWEHEATGAAAAAIKHAIEKVYAASAGSTVSASSTTPATA